MATADRASRRGPSRERIVEAALAVLDRAGGGGLSMRSLADELGVGTMTLYGYFRSKDELLDAIVDSGAERIAAARADGGWKEQLRALVLEMHRRHLAHPAIVELRLERPLLSEGALTITERGVAILRDAGFSKRDAVRAYRLLFVYTFGFSAFGPGPARGGESEASRAALAALDPGRYPVLTDSIDEAVASMADASLFEFGLDRLLDGLELMLG